MPAPTRARRAIMKRTDIVPGGTYTNGKGAERRVIGDADTRYSRQADRDVLQYEVVAGRRAGQQFTMTRTAFARWAFRRIDTPATQADAEARG